MGVWETPSAGSMAQVEKAKADVTAALNEIAPIVERAKALSTKLATSGVTFKVQ